MSEWSDYNKELKASILKPTKKEMLQMDNLHLTIFELNEEKESLSESLRKVNEKLERYYKKVEQLIDSDNPPNWAWKWMFKKSSIKWKEHFIKRLGQVEANKIISIAKQKEYPKIGIQFIDPHPDSIPTNPIEKKKQLGPKRLNLETRPLSLKERLEKKKGIK